MLNEIPLLNVDVKSNSDALLSIVYLTIKLLIEEKLNIAPNNLTDENDI
jgi:hypothetical protein